MAATTTHLALVLLSALLHCAILPSASEASSVNITSRAHLAFPDYNTCMHGAVSLVRSSNCDPHVFCSSDFTLTLTTCVTTGEEFFSLNATYYFYYIPRTIYTGQEISIDYPTTHLLWTFSSSKDLANFYSAAVYNSTCNVDVDKTALSIVMNPSVRACRLTTATLPTFATLTTNIVPNSH